MEIVPLLDDGQPEFKEEGTPTVIEVRNYVREALCLILGIDIDCTDEELIEKAKEFRNE